MQNHKDTSVESHNRNVTLLTLSAVSCDPTGAHVPLCYLFFFFSSRRRHTRLVSDWSSDVCSSDLPAFIDRRQGHFEKAVLEFREALALDPQNPNPISDLAYTLYAMREFRASEEVYDQLINRFPDQPMLKIQKEWFINFMKTGDDSAVRSAVAELPASTAMDRGVSSLNIGFALNDRDWPKAKQLLEQVKGGEIGGEDDGNFGYATVPGTARWYSIFFDPVSRA